MPRRFDEAPPESPPEVSAPPVEDVAPPSPPKELPQEPAPPRPVVFVVATGKTIHALRGTLPEHTVVDASDFAGGKVDIDALVEAGAVAKR